jgi:D-sedoheptulose 7-phosphate isomerase
MSKKYTLTIKNNFEESIAVKQSLVDKGIYKVLEEFGVLIASSILKGGKVMICGNGGSAADAQHLVAEFLVRLSSDVNRKGLPALTLLQDPSTFTACSNDYSDKEIFSRNLETLYKEHDVLLVISTSGNSRNIIEVLKVAKKLSIHSLGFLGNDGGKALNLCDKVFLVPSSNTARIQEAHITAGHALIKYVENKLLEEGFLKIL